MWRARPTRSGGRERGPVDVSDQLQSSERDRRIRRASTRVLEPDWDSGVMAYVL